LGIAWSKVQKKTGAKKNTGDDAWKFNTATTTARVRELELELIQTQMAQKPMLRAEVGMRVRCANKASAE
jgi:hypothetical protein